MKKKKVNNFIDCYTDDIQLLRDARYSLHTHPLFESSIEKKKIDAGFCRLFIVWMVSSLDFCLSNWRKNDGVEILDSYFSTDPKATNSEKIKALNEAFVNKNIIVDENVFKDFLAIKFLRSIIVHGDETIDPGKAYWINERGFPLRLDLFDSSHWERLQWIEQNLLFYVSIPTFITSPPVAPIKSQSIYEIKQDQLPRKIFSSDSFFKIASNNFNEIYFVIDELIFKNYQYRISVQSQISEDSLGLDSLCRELCAAGVESNINFKDIPQLGDVALYSWSIFNEKVDSFLDTASVKQSNKIVRLLKSQDTVAWHQLCQNERFFKDLLWDNVFVNEVVRVAESTKTGTKTVLEGLHTASRAHEIYSSAHILELFCLYLPLLIPSKRRELISIGTKVLESYKLKISYQDFFQINTVTQKDRDLIDLCGKTTQEYWWNNLKNK
jgi:hypothetical protein